MIFALTGPGAREEYDALDDALPGWNCQLASSRALGAQAQLQREGRRVERGDDLLGDTSMASAGEEVSFPGYE